jgi:hypothetical protein
MSENGNGPGEVSVLERLPALAEEARAELKALDERKTNLINAHKVNLALIDAERKRLARFLSIIDPQPRPVKKKSAASHERGVSDRTLEKVAATIRELSVNGAPVSQVQVCKHTGMTSSSVALSFKELRSIGFIGKMGRFKPGSNAIGYKILDDGVMPREFAER